MSSAALRALAALTPAVVSFACSQGHDASAPAPATNDRVVAIAAKRFEYTPAVVHVAVGQPVVFELTSSDVVHGFNLPDFAVRADIVPGTTTRVRIVPDKAGSFPFHCDHFCGEGHEMMTGEIVVE